LECDECVKDERCDDAALKLLRERLQTSEVTINIADVVNAMNALAEKLEKLSRAMWVLVKVVKG
jgi:hypothetical protein